MALPRSTGDLGGLRAARWIRESTDRQGDRYGPDAQREMQNRAIERHGLVDTGIAWQVHHSGRTVSSTSHWAEMMAAAGRDYDIVLVGYVSRFARDLRTAVNARHDLHAAGAALLFCDERVLSSDEDAWETWAREAVEAEAYSRRLGRRIREGYEAKFRRHADPGGSAPLGFRRVDGLLSVDPAVMPRIVAAFERYANGGVSLVELEEETGIRADALRETLKNPLYNGWATRRGERSPALWRASAPVDDDLWARVQLVRERRITGGGGARPVHTHLLSKLLWCVCGDRVRADGERRYRHARPCEHWQRSTYVTETFEAPIRAQVSRIRLTPSHLASLEALTGQSIPPPTSQLRRKQIERTLADKAGAHARRELTTEQYLAEHRRLTSELDALTEAPPTAPLADTASIIRRVADIGRLWALADEPARARLVKAIYERVTVRADQIVGVELTRDAWRHGLAFALPEKLVMARPAGFEPSETNVRIRIAGREEFERALRRIA